MTEVHIRKGVILLEQGRYTEAALTLQDALSQNPDNDYALYLLAYCYYHNSGKEALALQTLDQAIIKDPQHGEYHRLRGLILTDMRRREEGLQSIERAIMLDPFNADHYAARAYAYICNEQWILAEEAARRALQLNADHMMAGNLLATALQMQNRLDENQALVSDLLAKDPHDALSHSNAGWVHFRQENFEKAREHFKEALRLSPNFEPARIGMVETVKARSGLYRLYVRYTFWMSRLTPRARIFFVIGLVVTVRMLQQMSEVFGNKAGIVLAACIAIIYLLFVMWTWFAESIGNLIILKDPFARYALKPKEKQEAVIVGGSLIFGVPLLLTGFGLEWPVAMALGACLCAQTVPFTVMFRRPSRITFLWMGGMTGVMWLLGVAAIMSYVREEFASMTDSLLVALAVVFAASTWIGMALVSKRT